ncbi:hypothetical protein [Nonomuraea sp. NPDC049158]|uniref:hypothetical protein n=1 Tax=Nonomuraea sp. NPDC049158 TaxID=3155649 RepID=UPI0033E5E486
MNASVSDYAGAATAPGVRRTVTVLESETHLLAALDRHGYRDAGDGPFFVTMAHDLRELAEPEPSPGYRLRTVGDADVPGRVAAHRWPRGDDAYPVPARLYRGLGFHDITRSRLLHS